MPAGLHCFGGQPTHIFEREKSKKVPNQKRSPSKQTRSNFYSSGCSEETHSCKAWRSGVLTCERLVRILFCFYFDWLSSLTNAVLSKVFSVRIAPSNLCKSNDLRRLDTTQDPANSVYNYLPDRPWCMFLRAVGCRRLESQSSAESERYSVFPS